MKPESGVAIICYTLYLIRFCFSSRFPGNAVGYVRLLQSGSKNANYRSRSFMSRFNSKFVRSADTSLDKSTEGAIREYEKSVEHLKECYSDCTNYFKVRQINLLLIWYTHHSNPINVRSSSAAADSGLPAIPMQSTQSSPENLLFDHAGTDYELHRLSRQGETEDVQEGSTEVFVIRRWLRHWPYLYTQHAESAGRVS